MTDFVNVNVCFLKNLKKIYFFFYQLHHDTNICMYVSLTMYKCVGIVYGRKIKIICTNFFWKVTFIIKTNSFFFTYLHVCNCRVVYHLQTSTITTWFLHYIHFASFFFIHQLMQSLFLQVTSEIIDHFNRQYNYCHYRDKLSRSSLSNIFFKKILSVRTFVETPEILLKKEKKTENAS